MAKQIIVQLWFTDQWWGMGEECEDAAEEGKGKEQTKEQIKEQNKEPEEGKNKEQKREPTPAVQPGTLTPLTVLLTEQ